MKKILIGFLLLALVPGLDAAAGQSRKKERKFKMGMTLFPFDLTPEAAQETRRFVENHADLISIKQEDGIPWAEALADNPFPDEIERKWEEARKAIPPGYKLLLALSPVKGDQGDFAPVRGGLPGELHPKEIRGQAYDNLSVIQAYSNYCRRAVKILKPDYISVAIDCTKIVHTKPKEWPAFARLVAETAKRIKADNPRIQVGVTHVLPMLWNQQIARAVKPSLRGLDFLGVSFFPYASPIYELTSGRPLPRGVNQWRTPLGWLRKFTRLPIAICETGYASEHFELGVAEVKIEFKGDVRIQQAYVMELLKYAERDKYLFVVWQIAIDLDRITDKLPDEVAGFLGIMKDNGFLTHELKAKPALEAWDRQLRRNPKPE